MYAGTIWTNARICGTIFAGAIPDTTGANGCDVPEPTTLALMTIGLAGFARSMRHWPDARL